MTRQKRQQKRYIKRYQVEFTDGQVTFCGISSDFSIEGFFVRSTHPMPEGSVLDFFIFLSADKIVNVKGQVMRSANPPVKWYAGKKLKLTSEKQGMGVKILERDEHYLHLIRSLLP